MFGKVIIFRLFEMIKKKKSEDSVYGVHTLCDPSGYPSGGSPLIGTVSPGPNWPFLSPP